MKFIKIKCNLCGESKTKMLATCKIEKVDCDLPIGNLNIVRCVNCGLAYVNPRPEYSPDEFDKLYSQEYFNALYGSFYFDGKWKQTNGTFMSRLNWIEQYIKKGKILDIGCATGEFLEIAKESGWDVYGIDPSKTAANIAKKIYNLDVMTKSLEEADFANDFFDVVRLGDLLEHVEDPKSLLLEIYRILKKGGLLYIAVPDFSGIYYKIAILISYFNHKNYFALPQHIYFFDFLVLNRYLKEANFNLIDFINSEAIISLKGFKGKIMRVLFFIAKLIKKQNRLIILTKKNESFI